MNFNLSLKMSFDSTDSSIQGNLFNKVFLVVEIFIILNIKFY